MNKWEKTIFWIVIVTIGILLIGSLFGLDFIVLVGTAIFVDIVLILDTTFLDWNKWSAFWLKILIFFCIFFIVGILLNAGYYAGRLFAMIIFFELIKTIGKKKVKNKHKNEKRGKD